MNILFLCTGNSCRSQMAEGWAKKFKPDRFQIQSAGIEAHGKNPHAIAVMKEMGIDISQQESTKLNENILASTDYLVTVCSHAEKYCPDLPAKIKKEHWPLFDPAKAAGSDDEIINAFRASRDDIRSRIAELFTRLGSISNKTGI